jgi:ligand-binding sensor domain-containing protein
MDSTRCKKLIRIGLIAVVIGMAAGPLQADIREWESITSFNDVKDMVIYNGDVWVASTGGLVRIDPDADTFETFTNVNGLGMNEIYSLCVDDRNRLWVGGNGRLVDFSDPAHPDGYLFTDRDDRMVEIYDIDCVPGGDSLWLANRLGVTIFLPSEGRGNGMILDTYSRLGNIERDTPARSVTMDADSIWIGTEGGLAVGSRHDIRQLKAPTGWVSYFPTQLSPLTSDRIDALVALNDSLYLGTTAGLYRFDRYAGPSMTNLGLYRDPAIANMSAVGDSVLVLSGRGSIIYHNGNIGYLPTEGLPIWNTTAGAFDDNGRYWNGNLWYGIYYLEGSVMIPYHVGGTPVNECHAVIHAQGKLWGAFGNLTLAYFENGRWIAMPGVSGIYRDMDVGPLGELWVATHGEGVYRILGDSVVHLTDQNSGLSSPADDPGAIVVPGIFSTGDAIWLANWKGQNGELVAINPYNLDQWQNYIFIGGSDADLVVTVTAGQEVVYLGSEENGIYAVAYAGTPFYTGDDYRWTFTSSNSGIGSDFVNHLAIDGYDTLWVGTAYGLSYQSLGEIIFTNIVLPEGFGPAVTSLGFDSQGSLYAGSGTGMVIRDIGTGLMEVLTARNSGLVDDVIHDIYYQRESDALWISTAAGISRLTMPYKLATQDLKNIDAYPNPYVIRYGNETVRFNFSGMAEIRIYTLAGELVREIPVNGEWDGRNSAGETVASGVYLFTLTDRESEVGRGKILLIRE